MTATGAADGLTSCATFELSADPKEGSAAAVVVEGAAVVADALKGVAVTGAPKEKDEAFGAGVAGPVDGVVLGMDVSNDDCDGPKD